MNLERETEIRRLQRKINELIETVSNDFKNDVGLIINDIFLHEIATAITELNILPKQSEDAAQQSQLHIIEQVARSPFHHKGCPHKGELDVQIVKASVKITGLHKAAINPINIPRRTLSPASQHNIHDKIVNNEKNNVIASKYKNIESKIAAL